jgi:hypothetical protein
LRLFGVSCEKQLEVEGLVKRACERMREDWKGLKEEKEAKGT